MTTINTTAATTRIIDGDTWFLDLPALVQGGLPAARGPGEGWFPVHHGLDVASGTGLAIGYAAPDQTLTLELNLTGWHVIHIGQNPAIRVWLQDEQGIDETGYCELPGDGSVVRDTALPAFDMTGKRLCIAPVRSIHRNSHATVFYLRATSCEKPTQHRNLIVTDDGHGVFHQGMDQPRDLYSHLYPFRNSDVFRILWGNYGGAVLTLKPDSPYNDLVSRPRHLVFSQGSNTFHDSVQRFAKHGHDPLAIVRQATRDYGLELHYYIRMAAFYGPYPHLEWTTRFFRENPSLRCVTEEGKHVNILSYAYEKVQDYMLGFLDELLDYQPEGLCLAFNRGLPLMICEPPVLAAFKAKTGRDAKLPEDGDHPAMLQVRNELLTAFVKRVKQLTDKRSAALSCIVPRDFEHNRLMGLDIHAMVEQGLFEAVHVGAGHGDDPRLATDLSPLESLKGHGAKIYPGGSDVRAHGQAWQPGDPKENARRMQAIIDHGYDGGWFWDAKQVFGYDLQAMRALGDPQKRKEIIEGKWPAESRHQTAAIHDLVVGRYNPWHAY